MKHPESSIQSQYAASTRIRSIIDAFNESIDPEKDIQLFYEKIFDINTAEGIGLDIWGRILGISRMLHVGRDTCFGFEGSEFDPFDQNVFYTESVTSNFCLEDATYRHLLLHKAASNIAASDIATLNRMISSMLNDRSVYIIESSVMCIRFYFEFHLLPYEKSLMKLEFIPPRPAGVGYEWLEILPAETLGFNGSGLQPFNQGIFTQGITVPEQGA